MRLIDADALGIGNAKRQVFEKPEYADGWNAAIEIIENAPTIDAVPVVRCGECVYYNYGKRFPDMKWCCRLKNADGEPARYLYPPDGFCCYGARREVDGDG